VPVISSPAERAVKTAEHIGKIINATYVTHLEDGKPYSYKWYAHAINAQEIIDVTFEHIGEQERAAVSGLVIVCHQPTLREIVGVHDTITEKLCSTVIVNENGSLIRALESQHSANRLQ